MKWLIFILMLLMGCASGPKSACQELYSRHTDKINQKIRQFTHYSKATTATIYMQTTTYDCEEACIVITRDFDLTWWNGTRYYTGIYHHQQGKGSFFEIEERPFLQPTNPKRKEYLDID